jgi:sugar/nucleoside kinase (ribokinase family)
MSRFGLIGTITYDVITSERKTVHEGLGGILHQTAVLCGLGYEVNLYTNLGQELETEVRRLTEEWKTLNAAGINMVSGPGNRVFLDYTPGRERIEVLKSIVPPIDSGRIIDDLPQLDFLVMVFNSGFDMERDEWERVKKKATCPIWMDIHSLLLEKKLNRPRAYVTLEDWKDWVVGIDYLQANSAEAAALLGCPHGKNLTLAELESFGAVALEMGIKAVFLTRGEEGLLLVEKEGSRSIAAIEGNSVVDTTGCGDVLCAGAAVCLSEGGDPYDSASYGMRIASAAVSLCGVPPIYDLMRSDFFRVPAKKKE